MASSAYYKMVMNHCTLQINSKTRRRDTCVTVQCNIAGEGTYYELNQSLSKSVWELQNGIFELSGVVRPVGKLEDAKETSPSSDQYLSRSIESLSAEINSLNQQIDTLRGQYNAARANYYAAKDREREELLNSQSFSGGGGGGFGGGGGGGR